MEQAILYIIILVVIIGVPVLIARKSGISPMEALFGKRVNKTAFAGKSSSDQEKAEKEKAAKAEEKKEKNSNRNDLIQFVSYLTSYARRNRFFIIVPGTLEVEGSVTMLTAIVVTRKEVLGFNCFGYGGKVSGKSGSADWLQVMNQEAKNFPSPSVKNASQLELLKKAMKSVGLEDIPARVIGVFTSPTVQLSNAGKTGCYSRKGVEEYLRGTKILQDGGVDPKAAGKALGAIVKKDKK